MEQDKNIANTFNEYKDFIKDKQVSFIIKKTERIVYGVYMLSRFVPAQETLSTDLKKTSNILLGHVSSFVNINSISQDALSQAHSFLQYLSSLLTLSFIEGYISQSNIELMKHEINYLHKHIEELSTRSATDAGQLQFKADQFVVSQSRLVTQRTVIKRTPESNPVQNKKISEPSSSSSVSFKKPAIQILKTESSPKGETIESREKAIIDVIRDKEKVSIKDISTVIFDVSEKTIQRTLQTLIDKGQVVKEGERRWARYELK